ncbi:Ig-like domain-containing protein [Bradyrhizobium sp. dw_411]|uniref:Ig-like domain-containing protein n=1 Tax=Bradyrhizobium sp. dw_411 TaxID=2720082 RepID=UPI001BD097C9|nr:Ig-like domain-containing protein [Bradyrhizobium sp. dw_411]
MATIPLSWNDPLFSGLTNSNAVEIKNGGTLSNYSTTDEGGIASVLLDGSATLNDVRINSNEGLRIGGNGNITINNSFIETTGLPGDHADGVQAYSPGGVGNVTVTNTTIMTNSSNDNAGFFVADSYSGTFTFDNVVFDGGLYGLRINADAGAGHTYNVALKDVYFIQGSFTYDPFLIYVPAGYGGAQLNITEWDNVRWATIENGVLVPGALIAPPQAVVGGGSTTTPPPTQSIPNAPAITSGDHVTNDNTVTVSGTAVAGSTVAVFDGTTKLGTTTVGSNGAWTYTTAALTDGKHSLTATDTVSGQTSAASSAATITVDTHAPAAPVLVSDSVVNTNHVLLSGTAEANSTVTIYDGTTVVGTATAGTNGAWSVTTSALASGAQALTAKAQDAAGNTSVLSQALDPVIGSATPPAAPKIVSYSQDSGVVGDGITNDNILTLTGTAAANSTVKVFDGSTLVGTTTADASGSWTDILAILSDAKHTLTATAVNSSGQSSAASSALTVTIDTHAPAAPVLVSDSVVNTNHVLLSGTAEANSTITVYDGTTAVGTTTADSKGAWSVTTAALASGAQALTAKAQDAAGNTSALSQALDPVIGSVTPPAAPKIASFSTDSGVAGDHITNDSTLTLTGTAVASSTVKVFDGQTQVGTATANSSGQWSLTTSALSDGAHSLTATDTDSSGHTSAASSVLGVTVDTHAPAAPTMALYTQGGSAVGSTTTVDDLFIKGTAEANSTVNIFDGGKQIGTATANSAGAWNFDTGEIADGNHSFTSKAVDVAGNTSAASAAKAVAVTAPVSEVDFTNLYENSNHTATIKGTADAYSQIKLFDGTTSLGSVTAAADGTWSFTTASAVSNTVHTFKAQEVDSTGHVVATSGSAILGSSHSNTLTSNGGDNFIVGNGHPDTFVFASNFGNDVIKDFIAGGRGHDVVQFSKSVFDSFADVLAHATQVGQDVVISAGANDSLTLKNIKLGALNNHDFHFA